MPEPTPAIRRLRRVAPLALVVVLAAGCGDDKKGTATPAKPPPPSGTTTRSGDTTPMPTVATSTKPKPPSKGKGTLVTAKRNLMPLLRTDLHRFAPAQVQGKSLQVVALAGPASFWAGRSSDQRILVTMRLKGGSAPEIKVGQGVDFIGVLTVGGDPAALGVRNGADRTLLEKQGVHVDASALDVKLH